MNPGSAITWSISGTLRVRAGDADLSSEHLETALRIDPLGPSLPIRKGLLAQARLFQGRFAEAVALAREYVQQVDSVFGYAILASSCGHAGQIEPGRAAIEHYRSLSPLPFDVLGRSLIQHPHYVQVFLEGIALAEGAVL